MESIQSQLELYKEMYTRLFNACTDAIEVLQEAQIETEALFVEHEERINPEER